VFKFSSLFPDAVSSFSTTSGILYPFCLQATINFLSEPVDVYNEWIDACEAANVS
jgi:transcription elongation factor Elf1